MYKTGCKILMITGIMFIVIGIYAVLFNNTSLFFIINRIMDPVLWSDGIPAAGALNFKIFTWDYLGILHVIWGINIFYVARYGLLKRKEAWAWRCIFFSMITLVIVDAYFTFTIKLMSVIPINIFFALLFIIPLIMTKDVLKKKEIEKSN
jgi:hypothetical protein